MFRSFLSTGLAMACGCIVCGATPALAEVVFDFEDQPQTGFSDGALTSLTLTSGGLTVTITRPGSPNQFDIYDPNDIGNPTFPASWGARSISPWFSNDDTAFVATFDRPVQSVSIDMGDFGQDADDLLLEAFGDVDGGGALIDIAEFTLPGGADVTDFTQATLTVTALSPQIRSIRFIGGTESFDTPFGTFSIPNSVYYDNLSVVVPAPGVAIIVAAGGALTSRRRR